jgi:putative acyl-CoA dehydrogenase
MKPHAPPATQEVTNQTPPLEHYNLYATDAALVAAVEREGAGWHAEALTGDGAQLSTPDVLALAAQANRHAPELFTYSPRGERIDDLEFHPSWHRLLALLRAQGLHALPFSNPREGAMAARCAGYFLHAQLESGSLCPLTMTFASIPVLRREPALFATLVDKLYALEHDSRDAPLGEKRSMMIGMGMTEKQGGSDVRMNRTRAYALDAGGRGDAYRLVGHKWFFSAPQCDAHLVLARTDGDDALSCFYVPRFTPDGQRNAIQVNRLKDKLGNRSNASGEVEFLDAYGVLIGEAGRGVPTIIEMANYTRLDCVIGSAALMRAALVQAIHHVRHRIAFGRCLADQPLMRNVLADLALESEAATVLFMRLARAFDAHLAAQSAGGAPESHLDRAWRRIVTPAAKFWVCKRALAFTGEAMEVLGGNGYVEESPMARHYREAPVNSIWEGSGNVMCLDVLRAIERDPQAAQALLTHWREAAHEHRTVAAALTELEASLSTPPEVREALARRLAQQLVLCAQAVLMLQHAPGENADAFIATRIGGTIGGLTADTGDRAGNALASGASQWGCVFGTLPGAYDQAAIVARAFTA